MEKENVKDGTILEFLYGTHSYEGVWYGDVHPTRTGAFWWRSILREHLNSLTPIELPSDEEIKKLELEYAINFGTNMGIGFKIGCQWIKEQILNQNKK